MGNFSTLEKWILWGTTIICAIIGLSIDGFLGFILLALVAYFATKFAIKKHDERFPASLTPQEREAMKKEKEEKDHIKAEKKAQADAEAQAVIQRLQKAKQDRMQAKMKCPRCGSKNIQPAGKHTEKFSGGKAAVGAAITGGVGLAAGLLGKNTKQADFVCMDCGKQFKK
ncbi:hypothetical protein EFQ23_07250 [Limosilactobacillus fermentum]|uniref:hypothetical protein n=2 Tax=Limosilactobacillus fermentum TaxID=1613 RepID=UPI00070DEE02|nr:hypothetical protein [Limosilactobacillus fermentum]MCH5389244.1 hypothetical protein [Limosilactobacillus fermentum]MCH5393781.1 hypothetical protein [Limosilactobacillus fermentum]MCT3435892.1 hypothetical protein [Limosilactobacillus fermentum]PPX65473.1 hypothetical protein C5O28_07330 [Limosilactobacillus fermentum]